MGLIEDALDIAADSLRACYGKRGIITGPLRQVHWSWDSFFASWGSLSLGDADIVKTNLELYRGMMREDGLIPRRVSPPLFALRFLGLRFSNRYARPQYGSSFTNYPSKIQNALFIATCLEYALSTGDTGYLKRHYSQLLTIAKWPLRHDYNNDGLIEESVGENWSETVLKQGTVLFTNVCHYKGMASMARIAELTGDDIGAAMFSDLACRTRDAIQERFWTGTYFADWHDGSGLHDYLSTDGNVLASLWGIADRNQARSIHSEISKRSLDRIPLQTNSPKYPGRYLDILTRTLGLRDYHNGLCWPLLGCIDAVARRQAGMEKEAESELERIAGLIVRDNTVHEIYTQEGKPYKHPLYTSEHPFAWSAGLFIWAAKQLGK